MFYIICDGKYLASKGMLVESKRAAYPYRSYEEAKIYKEQATRVHKLTGLKIVLR